MDDWLKQSVAKTVKIGPFIDDTDGKTPETALSISQANVQLSKDHGAYAQKAETATVTHAGYGWYNCPLNTSDFDTTGLLKLSCQISGALPVWHDYLVLPANVHDAIKSGTDYLQIDLVQWLGSAPNALQIVVSAVLDELLADHRIAGSAGKKLSDIPTRVTRV